MSETTFRFLPSRGWVEGPSLTGSRVDTVWLEMCGLGFGGS